MSKITGAQLRAARSLVGWKATDLADRAGIGVATIRRAELIDGPVNMTANNLRSVIRAFEAAGVIFIPENGEGAGVRLAKRKKE